MGRTVRIYHSTGDRKLTFRPGDRLFRIVFVPWEMELDAARDCVYQLGKGDSDAPAAGNREWTATALASAAHAGMFGLRRVDNDHAPEFGPVVEVPPLPFEPESPPLPESVANPAKGRKRKAKGGS